MLLIETPGKKNTNSPIIHLFNNFVAEQVYGFKIVFQGNLLRNGKKI